MKAVVQAAGLGKRYGSRAVLRDVSLAVHAGEIVALIGANGAGKTTLMRILLDYVRPSEGSVGWRDTGSAAPPDSVGYFGGAQTMPPGVSVRAWVRLVSRKQTNSSDRRRIRFLSRGSRQLLGLTATLARAETTALVLDEPWEGLDPDASRWLAESLRRKRAEGCASLVSSHRLHDLAGLCDRYAFLLEGRVVVRAAAEIAPDAVRGEDLLASFDLMRSPER